MPSLSTDAPAEGWNFVLQHPRLLAKPGETHPLLFSAYSETLSSIGVQLPGQPMRHCLFANKRSTRDRACNDGWLDVTQAYRDSVLSAAPKLSTAAQVAIYAVLSETPQTKADLVKSAAIADSEWRTTIRLLEERGVAACTLGAKAKKSASNRAYRYVRGPKWADAVDVSGG